MSFCGYCGSQMPDDLNFCTNCGKPLAVKKILKDDLTSDSTEKTVISDQAIQQDVLESVSEAKPFYNKEEEDFNDLEQDPYNNWNNLTSSDVQNIDPEELYHSLKENAERSAEIEKKKNIIPLVLTLFFVCLVIVLLIGVFKPFDMLTEKRDDPSGDVVDVLMDDEDLDNIENQEPDTNSSSASSSDNSSQSSTSLKPQSESEKEPEIVDAGGCTQPVNRFSDYVTLDYYYDIHNPNTSLIIQSPGITVNIRSDSGAILATDSQSVGLIMPGDTVRIFGNISILKSEVGQYSSSDYQLSWRKISTDSGFYNPLYTTDFEFSNVSARSSNYSGSVTGELTNNSDYDITLSQIYAIFKKNGEIVMISDGFTDGIPSGQTRVFEINTFDEIPDYDSIEMYIEPW